MRQLANRNESWRAVWPRPLVEIESVVLEAWFCSEDAIGIGAPCPVLTILTKVDIEAIVAIGIENKNPGRAILTELIRPAPGILIKGCQFLKGARCRKFAKAVVGAIRRGSA